MSYTYVRINVVEILLLPGRHECPGPHVPVLLLGPDERLGVTVGLQHLPDLSRGEGTKTLQPDHRRVLDVVLLDVLSECVVMLPGHEHQPLHPGLFIASIFCNYWKDFEY